MTEPGEGKTALVLGASGQVGQALALECARRGWGFEGSFQEHPLQGGLFRLDLGDLAAVGAAILDRRPRVVFLCSGWTWVDGCEDDPAKARLLNALAPEAAAKACTAVGALLVCYSTDYIFGEEGGPYAEEAPPDPLGVYGASKLEGERLVLAACPRALILRTSVVYGPEPQGKNFIYQMLAKLKTGSAVSLPSDQITSVTYNRDLARASLDLAERGEGGVFNVTGPELIDRYAFACLAAAVFGMDAAGLRSATTSELKQKARRPLGSGLRIDKLVKTLGWTPAGPREGLSRMKAEMDRGVPGAAS